MPAISNALQRGQDISVCFECARRAGGTWPEGHVATVGPGHCPECKRDDVETCALSDWNWPGRGPKLDREF